MGDVRQRLDSREGLLDQLVYLLVELDALEPLLSALPEGMLTVELPESGSVLGALTEMAHLDENVHLPALRGEAVDASELERTIPLGQESLSEVTHRLRSCRTEVIATFEALDVAGWGRALSVAEYRPTAGDLALAIVRRDAAVLRSLSDNLRHGRLFAAA